jgi:glycosyltransferase involved in cell wall biosynthesis
MTIHFIYPHKESTTTPHSIGYEVSNRLRKKYNVKNYNYDSIKRIKPAKGDILIGHPHPSPYTVFQLSMRDKNWAKVIGLVPLNLDPLQFAYLGNIISCCHILIAITGEFWYNRIEDSIIRSWLAKIKRIDLAVACEAFPIIKNKFNEKGNRKLLYIGNTMPWKNTQYLSTIAQLMPEIDFGWVGSGNEIFNVKRIGKLNYREKASIEIILQYDFLISVSTFDANPTTILEAMCWGLIPVCTPESGYLDKEGIINIPLKKTEEAMEILKKLQFLDESELHEIRKNNRKQVEGYFNWDRFTADIESHIESVDAYSNIPQIDNIPELKYYEKKSPYYYKRYRNILSLLRSNVKYFFGL